MNEMPSPPRESLGRPLPGQRPGAPGQRAGGPVSSLPAGLRRGARGTRSHCPLPAPPGPPRWELGPQRADAAGGSKAVRWGRAAEDPRPALTGDDGLAEPRVLLRTGAGVNPHGAGAGRPDPVPGPARSSRRPAESAAG